MLAVHPIERLIKWRFKSFKLFYEYYSGKNRGIIKHSDQIKISYAFLRIEIIAQIKL